MTTQYGNPVVPQSMPDIDGYADCLRGSELREYHLSELRTETVEDERWLQAAANEVERLLTERGA